MIIVLLRARPPLNRIANLIVSILYAVSIVALSIGEQWVYHLLGSAFEVVVLVAIARAGWTWRVISPQVTNDRTAWRAR